MPTLKVSSDVMALIVNEARKRDTTVTAIAEWCVLNSLEEGEEEAEEEEYEELD